MTHRRARFPIAVAAVALTAVLASAAMPAAEPASGESGGVFSFSVQRQVERAEYLYSRNLFRDAVQTAETGLAIDPSYVRLWRILALSHFALQEYDKAKVALEVWRIGDPDSAEAVEVMLRTLLRLGDIFEEMDARAVADLLRSVPANLAAQALMRWAVESASFGAELDSVLASVLQDRGLSPAGREAVQAYRENGPQAAADALSRIDPAADLERYAGFLHYLVGRDLAYTDADETALRLLSFSESENFLGTDSARVLHGIHVGNGRPVQAAAALIPYWRKTDNPGKAASIIAGDLIAGGMAREAILMLDKADASFPSLPALQGKRMLALHAIGFADDLDACRESLRRGGFLVGLGYGEALIARAGGDDESARESLRRIVEFVRDDIGNALDQREIENWIENEQIPSAPGAAEAAQQMFSAGSALWDSGLHGRGMAAWGAALDRHPPTYRNLALSAVGRLYRQGMGAAVEKLLRRALPEMRTVDVAAQYFAENKWAELRRLVDAGGLPDGQGAYPALLKAMAYLSTETLPDIVTNPADVEHALRALGAYPPATEEFEYCRIGRDESLTRATLSAGRYIDMTRELVAFIIHGRREALYPILLESPQWGKGSEFGPVRIGMMFAAAGLRETAVRFFAKEPGVENENPEVAYSMAVADIRNNRTRTAKKLLTTALERAEGVLREQIFVALERLNDNREAAFEHSLAAFRLQPENHGLRLGAIQALVAANEAGRAEELIRYFELQRAMGARDVFSYLAQAQMELRDYDKAVTLWRSVRARYPRAMSAISGLATCFKQLGKPQSAIDELSGAARDNPSAEVAALLAEAHSALSQPRETIEWVELGLAGNPNDLRLLGIGARTGAALEEYPVVEDYSGRFIAIDPDSVPMHSLYGQSLMNQEKWDLLKEHNELLLSKNPLNLGALERDLARLKAEGDLRAVWLLDKFIAANFANDAGLVIRAAISAASDGQFRHAIPALRRLMEFGPNSATLTLFFGRISLEDGLDTMGWAEFVDHLDMLVPDHLFVGVDAYAEGVRPTHGVDEIPVVLMFGRNRPETLLRIDQALAERGSRAVLAVGEESLADQTREWADLSMLRTLAATGRWDFLLTDNAPQRFPGREDGEWTPFWLKRKWLDDRWEDDGEMRARLADRLRRLAANAAAAGIGIGGWLHPGWGDYGQRLIAGSRGEMESYLAAVGDVFGLAFTQTPAGYKTPDTDPLRIPVRPVGKGSAPKDVWEATTYQHPTRRAVLELAKVKSWHGQLPAAADLLTVARIYRTDPKEHSYFQARNAQYMGDVPVAIELAREARALDPESERTGKLTEDVHRLLRPLLTVMPRHWTDSNKEEYTELGSTLAFHATPKWRIQLRAAGHRWSSPEHSGKMTGSSGGAGVRYFFKPRHWVQAEARAISVNRDVGVMPEARVTWHGNYNLERWGMNGSFDVQYNHEVIESYDAALERVRANRYVAGTNFRFREWWEVDYESYYTSRTDGNDTVGMMLRPTFRVRDLPVIRLGYWMAAADSDRNPDEYYAPVGYQAHQAVIMYRQTLWDKLTVNAVASWGKAKTATSDWRNVLRANVSLSYRVSPCVSLGAGYSYLKLPDYTLNNMNVSLGVRF